MRVMNRVSFPGSENYEQYTAEFELTSEDVSPELLQDCNLLESMFVFNTLVRYQGLLFQYSHGYIDKKTLDGQTKRLFSTLTAKLQGVVKTILKNGKEDNSGGTKGVEKAEGSSTGKRQSTKSRGTAKGK